MQKFSSSVKKLFWDVDADSLELETHKDYIIERVLEKGSFASIKWLLTNYTIKDISDIISRTSNLSSPTVSFWRQLV